MQDPPLNFRNYMYNEIKEYIRKAVSKHTGGDYNTTTDNSIYTGGKYSLQMFTEQSDIIHNATEYYRQSFNVPVTIIPYIFNVVLTLPANKGRNTDTTFRQEFEDTFITSDEIGVPASTGDIITIDSQEVILQLSTIQHGQDTNNNFKAGIRIEFAHIIYPRYS